MGFLLESSLKTDEHFRITTFRKSPPYTWFSGFVEAFTIHLWPCLQRDITAKRPFAENVVRDFHHVRPTAARRSADTQVNCARRKSSNKFNAAFGQFGYEARNEAFSAAA